MPIIPAISAPSDKAPAPPIEAKSGKPLGTPSIKPLDSSLPCNSVNFKIY